MKSLCVIPARGGSKGILNKNLRKINGISLVGIAVKLAIESRTFDYVYVSTDSIEIAKEAKRYGAEVPFYRSINLSGDRVADIDVLVNAVSLLEDHFKINFSYVAMLQPTSPLRKISDVIECKRKLIRDSFDCVWTVSSVDLKYHPLKQLVDTNKGMQLFDVAGEDIIARQQLQPTYFRNGACYFFTRDQVLLNKSIYSKNMGYVLSDSEQISIDNMDDLQRARRRFKKMFPDRVL